MFLPNLVRFAFEVDNGLNRVAVVDRKSTRIHDQQAIKHFENVRRWLMNNDKNQFPHQAQIFQ